MWTWAKKGVTFSRNPLFYLVGWQSLNKSIKLMFLLEFHQFNFHRYT